ncbi:MAG: insulinase family protein, partial [bacterium]
SSVISVLYDSLKTHLYPTTTYHYNSGGDPKFIPELTYDQLLAFYKSHYHPSNAVFMTFGDMQACDLQAEFETKALSRFSRSDVKIEVKPEQRITQTVRASEPYAIDDASKLSNRTHIVMAWLLGPNTDLELLLKCNLLADVLLDTSASPLRQALENTSLGGAPSPLCGLEETNREMSFVCGLEGSELTNADEVEELILGTLTKVAEEGIPREKLEACLHQLELSHREIGGDGLPFGLQLIFSCMSAAIHRGDPIDLLDLDPVLKNLKEQIDRPDFIKELVREVLLDNRHCVRLCLYPDAELNEKNRQAEKERLRVKKQALSKTQIKEILELTKDLQERQNSEEPIEVLPKVGLDDIPLEYEMPVGTKISTANRHVVTHYDASTNGLVYHQIVSDMPRLTAEQLTRLPLFTYLVTELGSGGRGYLETQHIQHSISGGVNAFSSVRGELDHPDKIDAFVTFSSRSLKRNSKAMMAMLKATFSQPDFNEVDRIRDLIKQAKIRRESSITGSGHTLAMSAAASYFSPVSLLNHHLSGLEGVRKLKQLDEDLENPAQLDKFVSVLRGLHESIRDTSTQLLLVCESGFKSEALEQLNRLWGDSNSVSAPDKLLVPFDSAPQDQAWLTTTQVNFCATAYPTVAENHKDAAALTILAGVLRNGYLHRTIREQGGAYGGGAGHDAANGIFRFYSYRDPNLMATFDAFEQSIDWVMNSNIGFELIEESILGVISGIDAPASPAGEARQAFHNQLFGRSNEYRQEMRQNFLRVTVEDVQQVAKAYLTGPFSRAVVMSESRSEEIPDTFIQNTV